MKKNSVHHQYPDWKKVDLRKGMIENKRILKMKTAQTLYVPYPLNSRTA